MKRVIIPDAVSRRADAWLSRRVPAKRNHQLNYRSIYILPSKAGAFFLLLLLILLVAAINYQNSMLYGFTFLLGAVFAISILHCYKNLSGLSVQFVSAEGCLPGDRALFHFRLQQKARRASEAVQVGWPTQGKMTWVSSVSDVTGPVDVTVAHAALRRGYLKPRRLLVQSFFPLGLVRAWTWLDFGADAVIYPKPINAALQAQHTSHDEHGDVKPVRGSEDYQGLRQYVSGDSLKHVAWKQFAQRDELFTKDFCSWEGENQWLDISSFGMVDVELKLSFLCHQVLRLSSQQQVFGLRLGSVEVLPGSGERHKLECLQELGRYGFSRPVASYHGTGSGIGATV